MKRFAYRLERLLGVKAASELAQARELAAALTEEEARREAMRQGAARLAEARKQLGGAAGAAPRVGTLRNLELSITALSTQASLLNASHEESLARLETERQRYEQARRDRRVLERLRQHRREAWEGEYRRWEQGINDESALTRSATANEEHP